MPEKILHWWNEKLASLQVGTNVTVRVLDVDWGQLTPSQSLLAVVLEVNSSSMYKLGTKGGQHRSKMD